MHKTFEYQEGYDAYGEGDSHCPYARGSENWHEWQQGYQDAKDDDYESTHNRVEA